MQETMKKKGTRRVSPRNPTEAAITCQPYASTGSIYASAGVMRNFSSQGSYIETSRKYKSGTILIMRMVRYPALPPSTADEDRPRSICLAEVKWRQELAGQNAIGYGIGLRYLDQF
ncbi:MAG: PilZ domain-containing protein [Desulfosarcina sp.]|nr:PilZ domain-containing protein [Desulfosarcina sp.]